MVPVGTSMATEEYHPLEVLQCQDCGLAQLSAIVDPKEVFPPDYPYSSGNSKALHANFEELAREAAWRIGGLTKDDLVVDIGANDGTLLSKFTNCRTFGVEPTNQAYKIRGEAIRAPFTASIAEQIIRLWSKAKVITACNVLAHVEDLAGVMDGINLLLADDGILIAENHDLASIVDGGQWDTVYHEHLRFFDPYTFARLLDSHGFGVVSCETIRTHGGSFRVVARKGTDTPLPQKREYDWSVLADRAWLQRHMLREATAQGGVYGIGATARATTIINYCGLDTQDIQCVCEVAGSDKIGRYIPGTRIPVVDERALFYDQPERAVLFSWHLADSIVPKLRERGYEGEILLPLTPVGS